MAAAGDAALQNPCLFTQALVLISELCQCHVCVAGGKLNTTVTDPRPRPKV